jgi:DNA-binding NarL/FixJ family response regulator
VRAVLVGDVDDIRWVLRTALERHGSFEVVAEAATGESGLGAALLAEPDLVVLDLDMPDDDGLAALRRLRSWSPDTAVVVITGSSDHRLVAAALDAGATGVLRKGTKLSVIAERAMAFAEESRAERAS